MQINCMKYLIILKAVEPMAAEPILLGMEGYLNFQDANVWRQITFQWSDGKIWGINASFPLFHHLYMG